MAAAASSRPDARDIARMVSLQQMFRHLGWRIRQRNRADCGLCRGSSTGTVAYRERIFHCHRCHAGGDVYALVMQVQHCDFRAALTYVANMAGIRFHDLRSSPDARREIAERQRQRDRIDTAAETLAQMERRQRLECHNRIHAAERKLAALSKASAWSGLDWFLAPILHDSLQHDLAEYTLLSFGAIPLRAEYVLKPEQREQMVGSLRMAGSIRTDSGHSIEVVA